MSWRRRSDQARERRPPPGVAPIGFLVRCLLPVLRWRNATLFAVGLGFHARGDPAHLPIPRFFLVVNRDIGRRDGARPRHRPAHPTAMCQIGQGLRDRSARIAQHAVDRRDGQHRQHGR